MSLQVRAQAATTEYQKLQTDLQNAVEARQRLDSQLQENEMVKKEFTQLTPNNTVYKLIGPVLVQQDQSEAKSNVDTRLDFIRGEIKRLEGQLHDIGAKSEKKKNELVEIQAELQQQSQPQGSAAPASATPSIVV
jgi:prefoldin beta subunit